jgi:type I restriction enzyme S subunit
MEVVMSNVPQLRFMEFVGSWEVLRVSDILTLLTDFEANGSFADVKSNVSITDGSGYAWYVRATDLENKSALSEVKFVDQHSYEFLKKTKLHGAELLVAKRGEIGKVYFFSPMNVVKATLAPNLYLLKLNEKAIPYFVYSYFIGEVGNKKLRRINASSTIGALYKDDVKAIKVVMPGLREQQKIAGFLSAVDTKIEQLTQKQALLMQYKKGVMQKLFSQEIRFKADDGSEFPEWADKSLRDVCDLVNGFAFKSSSYTNSGGYKIVTISNVQSGSINMQSVKLIEEIPLGVTRDQHLKLNDLLISMTGNVGRVARVTEENCLLNQRVGKLVPNSSVASGFLFEVLNQKSFIQTMVELAQGGAQPNIGKNDILSFHLRIPPSIDEQQKIANVLSSISKKVDSVRRQINSTKTFKKGLLQQMFV